MHNGRYKLHTLQRYIDVGGLGLVVGVLVWITWCYGRVGHLWAYGWGCGRANPNAIIQPCATTLQHYNVTDEHELQIDVDKWVGLWYNMVMIVGM